MQQPELGSKIAQLRKEKGYTQEDLAAKCNMNVRSIQRIEKGEVEPRPYTLKILSDILEYQFLVRDQNDERTKNIWLAFMHISSFMPLVIVPLIIWILKRDEFPEIEQQGKDVINFQISMCIYLFAASFSIFFIIGLPVLMLLGPFIGITTIINTVRVVTGNGYYYPLTIKFVK